LTLSIVKVNAIKIIWNLDYLVAVTLSYIKVIKFGDFWKGFIRETCQNSYGAIAVSQYFSLGESTFVDPKLIAIPGKDTEGDILILHLEEEKVTKTIFSGYSSNKYEITCLDINSSGTMVAAATTEGKTIHVFDTNEGDILYTLTRGSLSKFIWYISFQLDSKQLIVSAEGGTIHLFKLLTPEEQEKENEKKGYFQKYTDMLSNTVSYAKFRINSFTNNLQSKSEDPKFSNINPLFLHNDELEDESSKNLKFLIKI